jgi:hypothetical protein
MSILLEKSKNSLEASSLLQTEELYSSSVHCAYYSCIQLMKHILLNINNLNLEDFNSGSMGKGSHEFIINQIVSGNQKTTYKEFRKTIYELKKLRIDADYEEIKISEKDSQNAHQFAEKIHLILKQTYNI